MIVLVVCLFVAVVVYCALCVCILFVVVLCGCVLCVEVIGHTVIWHVRLGSGGEHCQAELAVEVRPGTLPAGTRG